MTSELVPMGKEKNIVSRDLVIGTRNMKTISGCREKALDETKIHA